MSGLGYIRALFITPQIITADFIDHYSKAWGKGTFILTFKGDADAVPTFKFQYRG